MKRYLIHQIGEEPQVIQANSFTIDGDPREIRFFRAADLFEVLYLHALSRPLRELPDEVEEEVPVVFEPSVGEDW
jgi:hypothetical protein